MSDSDVSTSRIRYTAPDGEVEALLGTPRVPGPYPAILLIHDLAGLVDHIENLATRYAKQGYLTIAPDLYWRDTARKAVTLRDIERAQGVLRASDVESAIRHLAWGQQEGVTRALEWLGSRDSATRIPDLRAAISWLQVQPFVQAHAIAAIGYGMGGDLIAELALETSHLAAGVIYDTAPPPPEVLTHATCPLQGHVGDLDRTTASHVAALQKDRAGVRFPCEMHVYPNAPRGFTNDTRPSFTPDAAGHAWERTLAFLVRQLGTNPG